MRRLLLATSCLCLVGAAAQADEAPAEQPAPTATLQLAYTADMWSVMSGDADEDAVYLDDFDVQFSLDLEKAMGWNGANLFVYGLYTNGNSVSDIVGDLNGVANIETGVKGFRFIEAWIDQAFAGGRGSVRVGLYDLASEFDAGEVRALFLNSGHGSGSDFSQTGQNGPSMWPVTSAAVRVNYNFENGVYLRGAITDGVPGDLEHPRRTAIDFDDGDGALYAGEVGYTAEGRLYSLGVWTYSEKFPDLIDATTHDNSGAYIALEQRLMSRDQGSTFDLSGSLRYGFANDDINALSSFFGATLVATGLIPMWPDDQLGLGVAVAALGDKFRDVLIIDGANPAEREINVELTYYSDLTEALSIQPDIQWIINPGGIDDADDVWVFGLRLNLKKTFEIE